MRCVHCLPRIVCLPVQPFTRQRDIRNHRAALYRMPFPSPVFLVRRAVLSFARADRHDTAFAAPTRTALNATVAFERAWRFITDCTVRYCRRACERHFPRLYVLPLTCSRYPPARSLTYCLRLAHIRYSWLSSFAAELPYGRTALNLTISRSVLRLSRFVSTLPAFDAFDDTYVLRSHLPLLSPFSVLLRFSVAVRQRSFSACTDAFGHYRV